MDKILGSLIKKFLGSNGTRMDADAGVGEVVSQFQQDLKGVLSRDDIRNLINQPASSGKNAVIEKVVADQLSKDVGRFMRIGGFGRHILCQLLRQDVFIDKISEYLKRPGIATVDGFIRHLRTPTAGGARQADVAPDMYYVIRALLKDKDLVQAVLEKVLEENIREILSDKTEDIPETIRQATAKFIAAYADKLQPWNVSEIHAVVSALDEPTKKILQGLFKELGENPTQENIKAEANKICGAATPPTPTPKRGGSRRRRKSTRRRRGARKTKSNKYT